mgnify:CR=1 FL=1
MGIYHIPTDVIASLRVTREARIDASAKITGQLEAASSALIDASGRILGNIDLGDTTAKVLRFFDIQGSAQQTYIASAEASLTSLASGVEQLRTVLRNYGLTATS